MRRTSTHVFGLTMLAALAFLAAGCGGGGSKEAAPTTTEATVPATTEAATPEPTTTQSATTTQATPQATTTTSNLGGIATAKNCKELATLGQKFSEAFTGAANSQDLKKEAQLLKEFADRTPSDIRPDFEILADYMKKVADAAGGLKPGSTPDAATIAKLQKLATEINQKKLTATTAHIQAWVQKNCKK
jgi:hypothetical protein